MSAIVEIGNSFFWIKLFCIKSLFLSNFIKSEENIKYETYLKWKKKVRNHSN